MNKTYVCVGGMRNGKSYHRALDLAQTIMQEYPNQSVCVVSLDDYKKALADEREKTIKDLYASDKSGTLKELLNMARAEGTRKFAKWLEDTYWIELSVSNDVCCNYDCDEIIKEYERSERSENGI